MLFNEGMIRQPETNFKYSARERKAEREIDTYLKSINGTHSLDILAELKKAAS